MQANEVKIPTLADKAIVVRLSIRRPRLSRRDDVAEATIQSTMDDSSLTVLSHLFKGKDNPLREVLNAANEVYTYHRSMTQPWQDRGVRLLANQNYFDYTTKMTELTAKVNALLANHMPNYAQYVADDMKARGTRAQLSDYPTAADFAATMQFNIRFSPLPQRKHFLFDLNEHDLAKFDEAQAEAVEFAVADRVNRVMAPMQKAISKLAVPIGEDGAVFRDSLIKNIQKGIEEARRLNVVHNPELDETIDELAAVVGKYAINPDVLRESPTVRSQAEEQLRKLAQKMGPFMGAV